eukprot:5520583-Amphidinium_carterae.1
MSNKIKSKSDKPDSMSEMLSIPMVCAVQPTMGLLVQTVLLARTAFGSFSACFIEPQQLEDMLPLFCVHSQQL